MATFTAEQLKKNETLPAGTPGSPWTVPGTPSRSAAIEKVTNDLNDFQTQTFSQSSAPKRASSSVEDTIAAENKSISDALAEFETLKGRLAGLDSPNYQQTYDDLRNKQGVPQLEEDYATASKNVRELPYRARAAVGNAGLVTESHLNEQTAQDVIPLEITQANTLDRLKLAQDFINNSLTLKEKDENASREALLTGVQLAMSSIDQHKGLLADANAQKDKAQARADQALQFRLENNITTPFFNSGGTVYDSGSLEAIPDETAFEQKYGMSLEDAQARGLVGKLDGGIIQQRGLVLDLASQYPDAGIMPNDTLAQAQAKLKSSRIYQEQVRPPASAASDDGSLANTHIIDKNTDAGVAALIASQPGDGGYGDTYNAVKAKYGEQIANAYDSVFRDVFNNGTSVDAALNNAKYKAATQPNVSQYQTDTNNRILQSVTELLPSVSGYVVGPAGKATYKVPGTAAYDFNAKLETLKSNISFGALTQMREASKTGGALGQVSDREGALLESSLAALDIGQSPEQFKDQLKKIQKSIVTWNITAATGVEPTDIEVNDDGSVWQQNQDGSYTQIQ
jgi:hypothetical protein